MEDKTYIAIDLKSFYASVECVERGLNPLTANLVVADESRTEKTICLAVSPSLKARGISGRPRLFEVIQKVRQINAMRRLNAPDRKFAGKSYEDGELKSNPALELSYIVAVPRMALYIKYSTDIYKIYLKYIAPEDIHVYSIDEVFIDATQYLKLYKLTARAFAMKLIREVLKTTGITATAGVGTNLYLCKVAMDIVAKHIPADKDGVRIARLDEKTYRRQLWEHTPITDFWRVGKGYAEKLARLGLYTMGDVARCSVNKSAMYNEDLLYNTFGINAELLIDHAWGWEPCTMKDIKSYKPETNSLSEGQVLSEPYSYEKGKLIVKEMAEALSFDLLAKWLVCDQVVLTVGYDAANDGYKGETSVDMYGRKIPKHAHGTENLHRQTASAKLITQAALNIYERTVDKKLYVRRVYIVAGRVVNEDEAAGSVCVTGQMDMFTDYEQLEKQRKEEDEFLDKEKRRQQAELEIRNKYGKNALLKGMNLEEGATMKDRNDQIGGHKK